MFLPTEVTLYKKMTVYRLSAATKSSIFGVFILFHIIFVYCKDMLRDNVLHLRSIKNKL